MKPKPVMQNATIFWILGLLTIIVLLVGQYMFKVHAQNEARGYCSEADKILSEDEMRHHIMINLIKETVQRDIKTTSYNQEISFYISKYDINSRDKLIKLMQQSKSTQSFEENFGIIAAAYMSEYVDILNNRSVKLQSSQQIYRIANKFAEVDIDYLKKLPNNYTFIIQWDDKIIIKPQSFIRRIDSKIYNIDYFTSLEISCCDFGYIQKKLGDESYKKQNFIDNNKPIIYDEPELSVDDIDGFMIDWFFVNDAYKKMIMTNAEQVRRRGLYLNVADIRSTNMERSYPRARVVTACGVLKPLKPTFFAELFGQDFFGSIGILLGKGKDQLTTLAQWLHR